MQLTGHTILITGGSSGIGLALAERLLALGNEVVICGRRPEALQAAQDKLPGLHTVVADTGSEAARVALWTEVVSRFPAVDVVINNAGIQNKISVLDAAPWQALQQEIAINLEGPMHLALLAIPHLRKQARPALLNVSSGLAFVPMAAMPIYCATKAALHSFTLSLRHQLRATPIEVIEIIPPAVRTNLGGSHDFGSPLAEYADSVIAQLEEQRPEVTYEFSAKGSQASRAELDQIFKGMNGG
jgi:uncharacterized oxidoreductase